MGYSRAIPWVFLAVSLWGAWFTWNAYRPWRRHRHLSALSFFAGWLTTELALHHLAWQAVATAVFLWLGALEGLAGRIGLAITLVSWAGLAGLLWEAWRAGEVVERALAEGLGPEYRARLAVAPAAAPRARIDWRQVLLPFPIRRSGVVRVRDVRYGRERGVDLYLDVWHAEAPAQGAPVLLQIHGGGWMVGSKNEQGLPLMQLLASKGWVCVSVDYRLSPHATFPEHLIDVKRAIAWIREHIAEYGGDPATLAVTGGSAGGHLCSLVALTPGDPEYQPGFEEVDTSVVACVSFYGVYDFKDRHGVYPHDGLRQIIERHIMKASPEEAPEAYDRASPIVRISAEAPPFFVLHGTRDTLVPVEAARRFVEAFRERARSPIVYAELPGAQHAFEIFPSIRTSLVLHGVERFLAWAVARAAERSGAGGGAERRAVAETA